MKILWKMRYPVFLALLLGACLAVPLVADESADLSSDTKVGKHTVTEWRDVIDDYWGPGMAASEQLRIFDQVWRELDERYGAYVNHEVDMRTLRREYRSEVREGVSEGRFAAIMNQVAVAMMDAHTVIAYGPEG